MEWWIQWTFLLASLALFFYWIQHPPFKDWLLVFFCSAYFAICIGAVLVQQGWFWFPVRFLPNYFQGNLLYEHLTLPLVTVFYYHTTYHLTFLKRLGQAVLYSTILTFLEYVFERYTNLIEYHKWTIVHTFLSLIFFLEGIRYLISYLRNSVKSG